MSSTLALEVAVGNLRHELRGVVRPAPHRGPVADGMAILRACRWHRQLGCGLFLSELDVDGFRAELRSAATLYRDLVGVCVDAYSLCASRAEPLLDALAAGDAAVTAEIARVVPQAWASRMEPRVDFRFFRALADLALGTLAAPVEGDGARVDALNALATNDADAFEAALAAVVREWKADVEAQRARDALHPYAAATEAFVCIEGLALARLARDRGLRFEAPLSGMPRELL